jgi:hypothetical protein
MDIITNFAAGEEAIGAIFGGDQDKGKHKADNPTSSSRGSKRNNRKKKKKNQQDKIEASAGELVAAAERKKPRGPSAGASSTKCLKNRAPTIRGP